MQVTAAHIPHMLFCMFFHFSLLPPIETNLGEPPLRFRWNKVVMIKRVLPMLAGSLMMTIEALQVAIKDRVQNNASRLYITMTECELERPTLIIVCFTWQYFIGEKKKKDVENLECRKVFIFHLKEKRCLKFIVIIVTQTPLSLCYTLYPC